MNNLPARFNTKVIRTMTDRKVAEVTLEIVATNIAVFRNDKQSLLVGPA